MIDTIFDSEIIYCYPMSCTDLAALLRALGWWEVRPGVWKPSVEAAAAEAFAVVRAEVRSRSNGVVRGEERLLLDFPVFRRRPDLGINAWEID